MSIRRTRFEHSTETTRIREPKRVKRANATTLINRFIKKTAVENGLIDPSKPRFVFRFVFQDQQGTVEANTRSEARSLVKNQLGLARNKRLPLGVVIEKIGNVPGRDLPIQAVLKRGK